MNDEFSRMQTLTAVADPVSGWVSEWGERESEGAGEREREWAKGEEARERESEGVKGRWGGLRVER